MPRYRRRQFLAALGSVGVAGFARSVGRQRSPTNGVGRFVLSREDDALLEDLERRSFRYFWEQGDTPTGQVRDRARADGTMHPQPSIGSIAATGFGLTALCVAAERGWAP